MCKLIGDEAVEEIIGICTSGGFCVHSGRHMAIGVKARVTGALMMGIGCDVDTPLEL